MLCGRGGVGASCRDCLRTKNNGNAQGEGAEQAANRAEQVVHVFPIRPEEAHERQEGDREDDSRRNLRSGAGLQQLQRGAHHELSKEVDNLEPIVLVLHASTADCMVTSDWERAPNPHWAGIPHGVKRAMVKRNRLLAAATRAPSDKGRCNKCYCTCLIVPHEKTQFELR